MELLTIHETADLLRVSARQVRRYIHDGRLRVIRIGYRTVLIRRRELDAFLKANERRVASLTTKALRDVLIVLPPPKDFRSYAAAVRSRLLALLSETRP